MTVRVTIEHSDKNSPWELVVNTMHAQPDGQLAVADTRRVKSGERADFLYVSSSQYLVVRECDPEPQQDS